MITRIRLAFWLIAHFVPAVAGCFPQVERSNQQLERTRPDDRVRIKDQNRPPLPRTKYRGRAVHLRLLQADERLDGTLRDVRLRLPLLGPPTRRPR